MFIHVSEHMPTCSYEPDKKMYFRYNLNPTVRTARTAVIVDYFYRSGQSQWNFCHGCPKFYEHSEIDTNRVGLHISFKWRVEKENLDL